jgi:outer membrane protein OmpA-like peptidoglycan-associated protein
MIRVLERLTPAERRKLEEGVVEVTGEAKNRTILGIVAGLLKLYPNITFEELKVMLPDSLNPKSTNRTTNFFDPYTQRPYGVVQPGSIRTEIASANSSKKAETGAEEHYKMVHFTLPEETFRTGDGVEVLVANGIEDANLQALVQHVAKYGVRVVEFAPYRGGGKKGFYNLRVIDPLLFQKLQEEPKAKNKLVPIVMGGGLLLLLILLFFTLGQKEEPVVAAPVVEEEPLRISVIVNDKVTGLPMPGVEVVLLTSTGERLAGATDQGGIFRIEQALSDGIDSLVGSLGMSMTGYLKLEEDVRTSARNTDPGGIVLSYTMEPYVDRAIRLPHISYAQDRYELSPEAKDSLEGFFQVLTDNPGIVVEVRAHTDARPATHFRGGNQELSQRRAEACVEYLVGRGIDRSRLTPIGMAAAEPVITLDSIQRVKSPDEKERLHALNRRSDFRVVRTDQALTIGR